MWSPVFVPAQPPRDNASGMGIVTEPLRQGVFISQGAKAMLQRIAKKALGGGIRLKDFRRRQPKLRLLLLRVAKLYPVTRANNSQAMLNFQMLQMLGISFAAFR